MQVLVTGGAGFIGSNLVRELLTKGHTVSVLDNLMSGFRENLATFSRVHFVEGDVRDEKVVSDLARGVEVIFHLAASVGNRRSIERPIIVINVLSEQLEVLTSITSIDSDFGVSLDPGFHTIRCDVGALPLMPGYYRLSVGITQSYGALAWDVLEPIPGFRIEPQQSPTWLQSGERPGVVLLDGCKWMLQG